MAKGLDLVYVGCRPHGGFSRFRLSRRDRMPGGFPTNATLKRLWTGVGTGWPLTIFGRTRRVVIVGMNSHIRSEARRVFVKAVEEHRRRRA